MDTENIKDIFGDVEDSLPPVSPEPLSDEDIKNIFND